MAKGGAKKIRGPSSSRLSQEIIEVHEKPLAGQEAAPPVDEEAPPLIDEEAPPLIDEEEPPFPPSGVRDNICVILVYLLFGVLMFWKTEKTLLDGFYGSSVSLSSVGYGDMVAKKRKDKWLMSALLLFGFFFVADRVEELYDLFYYQAIMWLRRKGWYTDIWYINLLFRAIGVAVVIGSGTVVIRFIESMDWIDAMYLTVTSVTSVGFGDKHFKTTGGKFFATFWLLLSTIVAKRVSKWMRTHWKTCRSGVDFLSRRDD